MSPIEILQQRFGLSSFRPGQRDVMSALWRHRAALAIFPTGGGKSLCYQLPALMFDGITLVISPLIALMKDQIDYLNARGIPAARLDSSLTAAELQSAIAQVRSGELKLLYVAPERFNNERFLGMLSGLKVALFAIDEAHCISEWGHNFRPDYLKLAETARRIGAERVLTLTATATPSVANDIRAAFQIPQEACIVTGFFRANLHLRVISVRSADRDSSLIHRLQTRPPGSTIIYVTLQRTAEVIADRLRDAGLQARAYHAGVAAEERSEIQNWWSARKDGIVVATIAFGMGIDKADVRYVYHYNLPKSLESYSQEIGRAGRDGEPSTVEMFVCPDDVPVLENFAFGDTPTESSLRGLLAELFPPEGSAHSVQSSPGREVTINHYELSRKLDMRPLVLATALTYLELAGALRQGTPLYAGYEIRPFVSEREIVSRFSGEPARLIQGIFKHAQKRQIWYALDPEAIAAALGQERSRIVRAIEYLEEHGLAEVRPTDLRHRYFIRDPGAGPDSLTDDLMARFERSEKQEISRMRQVLEFAAQDGCKANALAGHFGEARTEPCGTCSTCLGERVMSLAERAAPPIDSLLDRQALLDLRSAHLDALGQPRQCARFLCGITSPAASRARLGKHELFGRLVTCRFEAVFEWCQQVIGN